MAKDLEIAVDKIVDILSTAFESYNKEDKTIDKSTNKFWKKFKKRLPEDFIAEFEANPIESKTSLKSQMMELGEKDRVKMHYAMYLYTMGIPIE